MSEVEWHNADETRVFHAGVGQDWAEWFTPGWNWRNFTFIHLGFELDHSLGGFEVKAGLAGFRVWFNTFDCGPGSMIDGLQDMREAVESGDATSVPLEELGHYD